MLDELGDELVGVSSGAEALERAAREEFAVILLDIGRPGLSGPALRVLYVSGYFQEAVDEPFLPKPFTRALLRERVRHILGR